MPDPIPTTTPGTSAPGVEAPDATAPANATPDATAADTGTPDATVPASAAPDATTPDATTPDATTPDATTPDATTPDTTNGSSAQSLQNAGTDANNNAGPESVGDPAPCPVDNEDGGSLPPGGAPPQQPGALIVTVTNAVDGTVMAGATVNISSGSGPGSSVTDGSGTATFNPLAPDVYQVDAVQTGFTEVASVSASVPPGSTSSPVPAAVQLTPLSVTLTFPQPVACPGHPFEMNAVETPSGGTFAWTSSGGGAMLTDSGGSASLASGEQVFLVSYQPDNTNGSVPAQSASVTVTYTLLGGTATATQPVNVHKIGFVVTDATVTAGVTQCNEAGTSVKMANASGVDTMVTDPKVQIALDPSCPRKPDCASNHRVGWLQTLISVDRRVVYTNTLVQTTKSQPLPLRDGDPFAGPSPHPFYDAAPSFTGDGDTQTVHHFDSPGLSGNWLDSRAGAPAPPPPTNQQLRQMFFQIGFHAWLVVQNKEWSTHDLPGSFAYQKNFDWSTHLDVTVDTTKDVGSRCTPASAAPTIGAVSDGKGSNSPSLMNQCSNELNQVVVTPTPGI